jgi:hypothetical protein
MRKRIVAALMASLFFLPLLARTAEEPASGNDTIWTEQIVDNIADAILKPFYHFSWNESLEKYVLEHGLGDCTKIVQCVIQGMEDVPSRLLNLDGRGRKKIQARHAHCGAA